MWKWFTILLLAGASWPAWATKNLSIEQLEQLLATLHDKPDAKVADQLESVQLTERVSLARLTRWEAEFPGKRAHQELVKVADLSAFLELPKSDLVSNPSPDIDAQKRMLLQALRYVDTTKSRLPNLFATRVTTHFETTPSQDIAYFTQARGGVGNGANDSRAQGMGTVPIADPQALHSKGEYLRTVTYRNGHEVLDTGGATGNKEDEPGSGLTTNGEFGPILATVMGDATHGTFRWVRWENSASGAVAEFVYAVPQSQSHYRVGVTDAGPASQRLFAGLYFDNQSHGKELYPAYHGAIDIDPATGAILRLSLVTDMSSSESLQSAIAVEYAPVTMGSRSYICAVRSVAFLKIRLPTPGTPGATPIAAMPVQINLNDVAFTHYHLFGSEVTIRASANGSSSNNGEKPEAGAPATSVATAVPTSLSPQASEAVAAAAPKSTSGTGTAQVAGTPVPSTASTPEIRTEAAPLASAAPTPDAGHTQASTRTPQQEPPAAPASGMVLHVQSHLVLVDVVVTEHNRPVHGLDRSRVHILQDGHEQAIASFQEFEPVSTTGDARPPEPQALPPDTYSNVPTLPKTDAVNVILLDALNTEAADQLYVRREMIRCLKTLPSGRPVAVFTLGSKLRLLQGFTADTGKALAALANKSAETPASLRSSIEQRAEEEADMDRMTDAHVSALEMGNLQTFVSEANGAQTGTRVRLTLEAFEVLARYLSGIPGRKNLVWLSGSFPLQIFAKAGDPVQQMKLNADGDFNERMHTTADLLAAARVAVYPVDARGVLGQSMFSAAGPPRDLARRDAIASSSGGGRNRSAEDTTMEQLQSGAEHASMDLLAQNTGGRAVYDSNGLQKAFADALSDGANYYALSYVPPRERTGDSGAAFHRIQVKVDGGEYQLAYRRAYYDDSAVKRPSSAGETPPAISEATTLGAPPSTQVLFQARVVPATDSEPNQPAPDGARAGHQAAPTKRSGQSYFVNLSVNPAGLTFTQQADGSNRATFECALVAYDAEGKAVSTFGRMLTFRFPPQQYRRLQAAGSTVPVHLTLDLPTGKLALRIVVYDPPSTSTGSLEIPLLVPGK